MSDSTAQQQGHSRALKAGSAAVVGTTIEWYDFYIYATAAAIVFPEIFFPEMNAGLGTLASFGTYAVAYFMRPLGGIIFGHIGDKLGRKRALTITLFVMGVATVLVGCLPSYESIGITAPILLIVLRIAQGLAVGGEWGGASLMAVESAPPKFKTFYGGFTQLGNPLGALMATGVFWILASAGDDVLFSWGWRVPFLFSIVLIGVGIWVRYRVEETPVFEDRIEGYAQATPLLFALKNNGWPMLLGFCIIAMSSGGYVIATTFVQSFATSPEIDIPVETILAAMTIASLVETVITLPLAWLGDKWGAKRVMFTGILLSFVVMAALVIVINNKQMALIYLLVSVVRITLSGAWAPLSTVMAHMFRPQARYTSMSLSYGVGAATWGGLSPAIATALLLWTDTFWSVVGFFGVLTAVALFGTCFAPQHCDAESGTDSSSPAQDRTAITYQEN